MARILGAALMAAGALKVLGGYQVRFSLDQATFYLVASAEVVLGTLLLVSLAIRVSAAISAGMLLAGVGRRILYGVGPCGCLGPLSHEGVAETALAAVLLMLAVTVLLHAPKPSAKAVSHVPQAE